VTLTRWLRVGWLILSADVLYWISGVAYKGEEEPLADWQATLNSITYFGGLILFALLLVGSYIDWRRKQREL
jgi:hypothetical protein